VGGNQWGFSPFKKGFLTPKRFLIWETQFGGKKGPLNPLVLQPTIFKGLFWGDKPSWVWGPKKTSLGGEKKFGGG